jgi:hypothetical protein
MNTYNNSVMLDNYFGLLKGLSRENKIKLAAGLINDVAEDTGEKPNVINRFFGAFQSDKSAEEMIDEIRESRNFSQTALVEKRAYLTKQLFTAGRFSTGI